MSTSLWAVFGIMDGKYILRDWIENRGYRLHMCNSCSVLRHWWMCLRCLHFSHLQCRLLLVQTKK